MWDIHVCVGCLATDVRMHSMSAGGLLQPYQLLTGVRDDEIDMIDMPEKLCWECAGLVNKFSIFRHKCERAQLLLRDIYRQHQEISEEIVQDVNRNSHGLSSLLSAHFVRRDSYDSGVETKSQIKQKQIKTKHSHSHSPRRAAVKVEKTECQDKPLVKAESAMKQENVVEIRSDTSDDNMLHEESEHQETPTTAGLQRIKSEKLRLNSSLSTDHSETSKTDQTTLMSVNVASGYSTYSLKNENQDEGAVSNYLKAEISSVDDIDDGINVTVMTTKARKRTLKSVTSLKKKKSPLNLDMEKNVKKTRQTRRKDNVHKKQDTALSNVKKNKKIVVKKGRMIGKTAMMNSVTIIDQTQEQMMDVISERQNTDSYKNSPHKCSLCYRGFAEEKTYKNHMVLHDPVSGDLECDICKCRKRTRHHMQKHIYGNHLRKYICDICFVVNYRPEAAKAHYMIHKGVTFPCHICGKQFRKCTSRLNHIRMCHPSDHVCTICAESFVSPRGLNHHTRIMHTMDREAAPNSTSDTAVGKDAYCSTCNIRFTSQRALNRHILISRHHTHERDTIVNGCCNCGETFATRPELKEHRRAKHPCPYEQSSRAIPWEPIPCTECGELMLSARKYRTHFQIKHGGEPGVLPEQVYMHICEICGKRFKCKNSLYIHRYSHKTEGEYKCNICSKKFIQPGRLKKHQTTHSDERPHVCAICGKAFKVKTALIKHAKSHTGEKPYECTICRKTFTATTGRNLHMRNVHHMEPRINPAIKASLLRNKMLNAAE